MAQKFLFTVALVFFFFHGLATRPATAGEVSLLWDPSTGATSYKAYHGTSQGQYTDSRDVGNVTQASIDGLQDCTTSYFAVTASNAAGESGFSSEVSSWPRPGVNAVSPSDIAQGQQLDLTITGLNFQTGDALQFSNPDVLVNSTTVDSCTAITANITVGVSAAVGPTDVVVTHANGVKGTGAGLLTITAAGSQPPDPPQNLRVDVGP